MDLTRIRQALADTVRLTGIEVTDFATLNPDPPAAMIYPSPFGGTVDYSGDHDLELTILILVSIVDTEGGQNRLDGLISTGTDESIPDTIADNETLDGTVQSARVTGMSDYAVMSLSDGGTSYLTAKLTVEVLA